MDIIKFALLSTLLLFSACSTNKQISYYSLSTSDPFSAPPTTPTSLPVLSKHVVFLHSVTIPEYLDRPSIVSRRESNQLFFSRKHQWAEPLANAIKRNLLIGLEQHLSGIQLQKIAGQHPSDLLLDVRIQGFEVVDNQYCLLQADWDWTDQQAQQFSHHHALQVPIKTKDYNERIKSCSSALGQLGKAIAKSAP